MYHTEIVKYLYKSTPLRNLNLSRYYTLTLVGNHSFTKAMGGEG